MEFEYTFIGLVLPERAQMSYEFSVNINTDSSGNGEFSCSVINNQLLSTMKLEEDMDVMTLRNFAHNIIQNHFSLLGFYTGIFYDITINRIYNESRSVNYVYGVENTDIKELWGCQDLRAMLDENLPKTYGHSGVLVSRALNDLMNALRNVDDAAFFCYRAIESLRNHNSSLKNITSQREAIHWESFRETSKCSRADIDEIKKFADDLRHGKPVAMTAEEVKYVLLMTWGVIRKYFDSI